MTPPEPSTLSRRGALIAGAALISTAAACQAPPPPSGSPTAFTFSGRGWGHGVGMSQWGARGRADAGHTDAQILQFYYPGTALSAANPAGPRVRLASAAGVTLASASDVSAGATNLGRTVALTVSGTTVVANGVAVTGPGGSGVLAFAQGSAVRVEPWAHSVRWGSFRVRVVGGAVELVLEGLSMDQFLWGLAEVPASWAPAALRAQSVAARTYTHYQMRQRTGSTYDIHPVNDEMYTGADHETSYMADRWIAAVNATSGTTVTTSGVPILAFYYASNGGWTARCQDVFVATLPYCVATNDDFDAAGGTNTRHTWSQQYGAADLGRWIEAAGRGAVGTVRSIAVGAPSASKRLDKTSITVTGTGGTATMTGNQLRSAIRTGAPTRQLYSTYFSIQPN